MTRADGWYVCRTGFVETIRAVTLAGGPAAAQAAREEWPAFGVIEVDQQLVESAAALAVERSLGSLDALHVAAALILPGDDLVFATWDRRLHAAAAEEGLTLIPDTIAD
jgi:predicted nucleic acid-binding protein